MNDFTRIETEMQAMRERLAAWETSVLLAAQRMGYERVEDVPDEQVDRLLKIAEEVAT